MPRRNNVVVFNHPSEALEAGFRPCKRCHPLEQTVSNQVWVDEIEYVLQTHYIQKLSLNELASIVHGDPSYLRHTYKKITGRTPQQRLTEIRLENASQLLKTSSDSISQIGIKVGIQNTAYFISLFKNKYGQTPKQYQFIHK